jgi:hypothetical protein
VPIDRGVFLLRDVVGETDGLNGDLLLAGPAGRAAACGIGSLDVFVVGTLVELHHIFSGNTY